ncbi:UNVERIFIED_CONTAM: hypothetical protein FKN15_028547 [Acipenser sinensis]
MAASTQAFHVLTPLLESLELSKLAGNTVYLKMDNAQPSGSFKIRGIGHLCQKVGVLLPASLPACLSVSARRQDGPGHHCSRSLCLVSLTQICANLRISWVARTGCKGFVCSSGGNAGLAAAFVAKKLGVPATIVVPGSSSDLVIHKLRDHGATVQVFGK